MRTNLALSLILALCSTICVQGQLTHADRVTAIVGDFIILQSEVEIQYQQQLQAAQGAPLDSDLRCRILDNLLLDRLFLAQAGLDSVVASVEEVESELDRRVKYFLGMFGSKEKMEEYYGKSIVEMKEDFKEDIRNQLTSDKMKAKVFNGLKVSPQEVKDFFAKIPKDSIPYLNSELEVGQIAMYPKVTDEEKEAAKKKIEKIKKEIEGGADFSLQAILYSEDPGSASDGGSLPMSDRGDLVPEFEAAAYKLDEKKMSDIVETPFGFHLIMLDERRGNKIKVRHILIKPKSTYNDLERVKTQMDTLLVKLQNKQISFREAVAQYSDDEQSKAIGGLMTNPKNGSTLLEKSEMEGSLIFTLDHMHVGEYSEVLPYTTQTKTGEEKKGYRIVLLKSETKPHKASLETDYAKIHAAAKQKKQQDELNKWIGLNKGHFFFKIDPQFRSCVVLKKWFKEDK